MSAKENKLRCADSWLVVYDSPEDKLKPGCFQGAAAEGTFNPQMGFSLWGLALPHLSGHFGSEKVDAQKQGLGK